MAKPLWFCLIELRYRGRVALTVPFLIGSLREPFEMEKPSRDGRAELSNLLQSILDDIPLTHVARIYRCTDIGQPVVSHFYAQYAPDQGLVSRPQNRITICFDKEFVGAESADALCDQLWEELGDPICEARFSYAGNRYHSFSEEDQDFIAGVKKMNKNKATY